MAGIEILPLTAPAKDEVPMKPAELEGTEFCQGYFQGVLIGPTCVPVKLVCIDPEKVA